MHILHVIGSMDPLTGGPCQGIRNSYKGLESLCVSTEVVCLDPPNASFLGKDTFPIYAIGPSKGTWCYTPKLIPWLDENLSRFDAVIVHGLWLYLSYATIKAYKQFKKEKQSTAPKLFLMPHGMLDPYFQRAVDRKIKSIRNLVYWKLIESKVVSKADGLLFTCQAELELARNTFRSYQPKKEINVGYGISRPPYQTQSMLSAFLAKCPEIGSQPYILYLSRIHPKKGVDLLIEAYRRILYDVDAIKFIVPKLVIAGPDLESSYGQKIQGMVLNDHLLKGSVFFPGMLSGDAKWGAFYGCEAFTLPSHQENFGIAVAEALACSKPVIISDQVNIWREIASANCGIVVSNTVEEVERGLINWLRFSKSEKENFSQRARATFEAKFTIESSTQSLLTEIKAVVEQL